MEDQQIEEIFDRIGMKYSIPIAKEKRDKLNEDSSRKLEELIGPHICKISNAIKNSKTDHIRYTICDEYINGRSLKQMITKYLMDIGYGISDNYKASAGSREDLKEIYEFDISW